jgi:hypothetical protein
MTSQRQQVKNDSVSEPVHLNVDEVSRPVGQAFPLVPGYTFTDAEPVVCA